MTCLQKGTNSQIPAFPPDLLLSQWNSSQLQPDSGLLQSALFWASHGAGVLSNTVLNKCKEVDWLHQLFMGLYYSSCFAAEVIIPLQNVMMWLQILWLRNWLKLRIGKAWPNLVFVNDNKNCHPKLHIVSLDQVSFFFLLFTMSPWGYLVPKNNFSWALDTKTLLVFILQPTNDLGDLCLQILRNHTMPPYVGACNEMLLLWTTAAGWFTDAAFSCGWGESLEVNQQPPKV